MGNIEKAIEKLNEYGQDHIVKIMDHFTEEEKEKISDQILEMNFVTIKNLYDELTKNEVILNQLLL